MVGTYPITRACGSRRVGIARYASNRRLADTVHQWDILHSCLKNGTTCDKATAWAYLQTTP